MPTPTYNNLTGNRLNQAVNAYNQVRLLLGKADAALITANANSPDKTEASRFTTWFGPYTMGSINTVKAVIHAMVRQLDTSFPVIIDGAGALCGSRTVAYVLVPPGGGGIAAPGGAGRVPGVLPGGLTINLCNLFFTAPLLGRDSQVGTIIHEVSHLVGNTQDVPKPGGGNYYGEDDCKRLARSHPGLAMSNADNYLFYCCSFPLR